HPPLESCILVVDDRDSNREILSTILSSWGFRIREAADGEAAIAQWQTWQPDLIFMDIRMPKLNGDAAIARIKQLAPQTPTVIVAVTASAFESDCAKLLAAGCDGFIRKPFQPPDILLSLEQLLGAQFQEIVPSTKPLPTSKPMDAVATPTRVTDRSLQILVADDNATNCQMALAYLKHLGYAADVAQSGLEVLYAMALQSYDVVLMDVQMPEMDGLEAARTIRREYPPHEQPYIIALTASDEASDRVACQAAGMDAFLTKPLRLEQLTDALKQHLST
ncbi:MAG: response regulator, partial [Spirulina sp. SIO3F2]|nr:response regulator [Spirulina sp. SIO3F2]